MTEPSDEPVRKGRSNAIVTYETLAGIQTGLVQANMALSRLDEKLTDSTSASRETLSDHEARLRVLEASNSKTGGARTAADWIYHAIFPLASLALGLVVYLSK